MTLVGIDLNATRVRAVSGPAGVLPRPLPLDGDERDLPLALALDGRKPAVGRAALALARRSPHLACFDILAHVGQPAKREWSAGRHRLDADQAVGLLFDRMKASCAGTKGTVLAMPAYLGRSQALRMTELAQSSKLGVLGSVAAPLALARIAHGQRPWQGLALLLDVDDHALSWTAVLVDDGACRARALVVQSIPALNARAWKDRLLDGIADRCVQQSRRDPRASADAEQGLFDQLDHALEAYRHGKMIELIVQAGTWFQNLFLPPADLSALCGGMVRQAVGTIRPMLSAAQADGPPEVLHATAAVACLPGLLPALQEQLGPRVRVEALPADAVAQSGHELAEAWKSIGAGHHDAVIPLKPFSRDPQGAGRAPPRVAAKRKLS
jgi:hypothetical protein